ncbi:MAG: hypothetical protein GY810_21960 [Aureispira sp.]|nr:hypothetical protein [Aureispira sp.]
MMSSIIRVQVVGYDQIGGAVNEDVNATVTFKKNEEGYWALENTQLANYSVGLIKNIDLVVVCNHGNGTGADLLVNWSVEYAPFKITTGRSHSTNFNENHESSVERGSEHENGQDLSISAQGGFTIGGDSWGGDMGMQTEVGTSFNRRNQRNTNRQHGRNIGRDLGSDSSRQVEQERVVTAAGTIEFRVTNDGNGLKLQYDGGSYSEEKLVNGHKTIVLIDCKHLVDNFR